MQLVPASAAAVARDFCCCCLLFDVWVALFFVVIVVCAVLIASISAILGVLQNGKHLQAQREGIGSNFTQPTATSCQPKRRTNEGMQPTNKQDPAKYAIADDMHSLSLAD
jgi:ABC-type transport system involved in cytochrome bd biosynthesis fused ATPase/permease subunit